MVKVKGKKVQLTTSEYVTKDLVGPKGKRKILKGGISKKKKGTEVGKNKKLARHKNKNQDSSGDEIGEGLENGNEVLLLDTRMSDAPIVKSRKWRNKQRVLVFGSRGISFRGRHFMEDLRRLLPHTKKESKMDKRDNMSAINDICEMKNCNKVMFFEGRKQDTYLWLSDVDNGPSMKFFVENLNTMDELNFTGNCLKGSRAILSFDPTFDQGAHYQLMKELLVQLFGTPYHHPKSQPFIDHVFTFAILDNRVWFRNFQIMEEDGSLVEIGPRFCLNPIAIFEGSFKGKTIWRNPEYLSPNRYRANLKKSAAGKYINKVQQKLEYERSKPKSSYNLDPSDEIFNVDPEELSE